MVETANVGGHVRGYRTPFRVDDHIKRLHPDPAQHRTEQRGFIFAVTVAVDEHVGSGMRLPASNAQFDGDVADVVLHELRQRLHLLQRCLR